MSNFIPGKIAKIFTDKKGRHIVFRNPRWEDLDELLRYINKISRENTYITYGGETIARHEEMEYLIGCFRMSERGDSVYLYALDGTKIIGTSEVTRMYTHRSRGYHMATFGISLEDDYRGTGIGEAFARAVIEEGIKRISGIELLILDVYSENERARKLYEKLGFKMAGAFPKGLKYQGRYLDDIKMYLPVEEYKH